MSQIIDYMIQYFNLERYNLCFYLTADCCPFCLVVFCACAFDICRDNYRLYFIFLYSRICFLVVSIIVQTVRSYTLLWTHICLHSHLAWPLDVQLKTMLDSWSIFPPVKLTHQHHFNMVQGKDLFHPLV